MIAVACTAMTVTDPATGRVIGVVDLTCAAQDVSPLMLPLAKRVAWEIEQRLLEDSSTDERLLREQFLRARRTARGPLIALNAHTMLVNAAAAGMVEPSDRDLIWDWVARTHNDGGQDWSELSLSGGGSITVRSEPVLDGYRLVGALVRLDTTSAPARGASGLRDWASTPADGWSSLTPTERTVADHVAQGMTNAEAAARLFLSPHTIDYHLRQVFRKLDLRSRVELTRAIVERKNNLP